MFRSTVFVGMVLAVCALLVGTSFSGDAKKEPKEGGKIKGMLPPGWKALKLSPEQTLKIYSIQTNYRAKLAALEEQIFELKTKERNEMGKVLTEEQKTLLRRLTIGEDAKEEPSKDKIEPSKEKVEPSKDKSKSEKDKQ